jgi:hypothetical protein
VIIDLAVRRATATGPPKPDFCGMIALGEGLQQRCSRAVP